MMYTYGMFTSQHTGLGDMFKEECKANANKLLRVLPFVRTTFSFSRGETFEEAVFRAKDKFAKEYGKVRNIGQANDDHLYK